MSYGIFREFLFAERELCQFQETSLGAAYGSDLSFYDISDAMTCVHVTEREYRLLDKLDMVTY